MTSVRKRKMARSSVKKNTRRTKDQLKKVTMTGHPLMAEYWDPKLTLIQNYKKLGLAVSLGKDKGGVEQKLETVSERRAREGESDSEEEEEEEEEEENSKSSLKSVAIETDPLKIPVGEARIIRDPKTNEVLRVIHGQMEPVKEEPKSGFSIIDKLEEYNEEHAKLPHVLTPSEREDHWLDQIYEKYGDDYEKMKWDKKLNPTFMSAGQLKKKVKQWKKLNGIE